MGKGRTNELPTLTSTPVEPAQPTILSMTPMTQGVYTLSVPFLEWDSGYSRRVLDVRLTTEQAQKLKSVQLGLEQREAQLENGRYVANAVDAVRWMIENLSREI